MLHQNLFICTLDSSLKVTYWDYGGGDNCHVLFMSSCLPTEFTSGELELLVPGQSWRSGFVSVDPTPLSLKGAESRDSEVWFRVRLSLTAMVRPRAQVLEERLCRFPDPLVHWGWIDFTALNHSSPSEIQSKVILL